MKTKKQSKKLKNIITNLSTKTGIYQFIDQQKEIIYIGKAKNIQTRVKQHFTASSNQSSRIKKMLEQIDNINFIETSNETEALILEANLINELKPKFNILLRNDKNFTFIKVTINEDFPRIFISRNVLNDKAKYFGPKTEASYARKTVDFLQKMLSFRTCNLDIYENEKSKKIEIKGQKKQKLPCLEFHIKKCTAPCVGKISKTEYKNKIDLALKFLNGKTKEIEQDLQSKIKQAAEKKDFEKAAIWRDFLLAIQKTSQKQIVNDLSNLDADVISGIAKKEKAFFHLFQIKSGRIIAFENFILPLGESLQESLLALIRDYFNHIAHLPTNLILNQEIFPIKQISLWENFFYQKYQQKVKIILPQKGRKKDLLNLAEKNAHQFALKNIPLFIQKSSNKKEILISLQKKLGLKKIPHRIEAFDISHFAGNDTVASMIVFKDGLPLKSHYRKFKLRTLADGEIDDFASMQEIVFRRLKHLPCKENLIVSKASNKEREIFWENKQKKWLFNLNKEFINNQDLIKEIFVLKQKKEIISFLIKVNYKNHALFLYDKKLNDNLLNFFIRQTIQKIKEKKIYLITSAEKITSLQENGFEKTKLVLKDFLLFLEKQKICHTKDFYKNNYQLLLQENKKNDQSFSCYPDLILIDGGQGQLNAALKSQQKAALFNKDLKNLNFCALAKKEEKVFIPYQKNPLAIDKHSEEGLMLQKIRNEAHRFAISFHRKIRDKVYHF